jgi:membrane fusion protein (multidrug efflux system)
MIVRTPRSPSMRATSSRCARVLRAGALTLAAALGARCSTEPPPPPATPPADVQVAEVLQRDVPVYMESIGVTRGDAEIEVRARIEGILQSVNFAEGRIVNKGDLLYTIDPREYEAALQQARARLAQAEADLARYEQDVARFTPLVEQNAVPRQSLDTAVAQVNAGRANVQAAQAGVVTAELDLSYTRIFSPTDGIIGKTEVNEGNLVGRGQSTLLTQISRVDPIRLRVSIAERDYLYLARRRDSERIGDPTAPPRVEMILADGSLHPHRGRIVFADRLVDPSTATMLIDIAFPNPERLVRPGQYGRSRVVVDTRRGALLVPQKAVAALQSVDTVAVVTSDNTVETRQVKTGVRVGTLWVIESGLNAGDRVVVEGLQKVRPGMTVNPTVVAAEAPPESIAAANQPTS